MVIFWTIVWVSISGLFIFAAPSDDEKVPLVSNINNPDINLKKFERTKYKADQYSVEQSGKYSIKALGRAVKVSKQAVDAAINAGRHDEAAKYEQNAKVFLENRALKASERADRNFPPETDENVAIAESKLKSAKTLSKAVRLHAFAEHLLNKVSKIPQHTPYETEGKKISHSRSHYVFKSLRKSADGPGYTEENHKDARNAFQRFNEARREFDEALHDVGSNSAFRQFRAADTLEIETKNLQRAYKKIGGRFFHQLATGLNSDLYDARHQQNLHDDLYGADTDVKED